MVETIHKFSRYQRQLLQEYGRDPTIEELSEKMGMPVRSSRMTVECAESCDAPVTLLVTAQPKERYVFLSGADVASALAAFLGRHVADGTALLSFDSGRWTVELNRPLSGHDTALLAEFCVPPVDISADLL